MSNKPSNQSSDNVDRDDEPLEVSSPEELSTSEPSADGPSSHSVVDMPAGESVDSDNHTDQPLFANLDIGNLLNQRRTTEIDRRKQEAESQKEDVAGSD